jgi:hypothetical protein
MFFGKSKGAIASQLPFLRRRRKKSVQVYPLTSTRKEHTPKVYPYSWLDTTVTLLAWIAIDHNYGALARG